MLTFIVGGDVGVNVGGNVGGTEGALVGLMLGLISSLLRASLRLSNCAACWIWAMHLPYASATASCCSCLPLLPVSWHCSSPWMQPCCARAGAWKWGCERPSCARSLASRIATSRAGSYRTCHSAHMTCASCHPCPIWAPSWY